MAVKETLIYRKGNIVLKKSVGVGETGRYKIKYWVYGLPNYYPMKAFHSKSKAIKFYRSLTK